MVLDTTVEKVYGGLADKLSGMLGTVVVAFRM